MDARVSVGVYALACSVACATGPAASAPSSTLSSNTKEILASLVLPADAGPPPDIANSVADDPRAAALGQQFFFDTRFSGPLLDSANDGTSGTLGQQGDTEKVACASCHMPYAGGFVDVRSPRGQLSLGSGWTHRKAPSLLDEAQLPLLMWDGRRDSAFSQVFSPIQSSLEFNSSPLFVAQQIYRLYRAGYEALFGPMPPLLTDYLVLSPSQAGCATFPADPVHDVCSTADDTVKRVVVNFGKAIEAYTRKLACGRSRFDQWMDGDTSALSSTEQAGAALFVGKASCVDCHSGPYLTDRSFHNLGIPGELVPFTGVFTANDPGAAPALAALLVDPLNTKGVFSDGYDGRLDTIPSNLSSLTGSFHTPSLRCVTRRVAFMHNGQFRSLQDAVAFLSQGPADAGYLGVAVNFASNLSVTEQAQLVAFLGALDGTGPDPALETAPALP